MRVLPAPVPVGLPDCEALGLPQLTINATQRLNKPKNFRSDRDRFPIKTNPFINIPWRKRKMSCQISIRTLYDADYNNSIGGCKKLPNRLEQYFLNGVSSTKVPLDFSGFPKDLGQSSLVLENTPIRRANFSFNSLTCKKTLSLPPTFLCGGFLF